jgi:putative transcriptional regulator
LSGVLRSVTEYDEIKHDNWFDGGRLEEIRKLRKLTQLDLERECGIPQCKISQIERGEIENIRIETLCVLCIYLACNPCDLIDDVNLRNLLRDVTSD